MKDTDKVNEALKASYTEEDLVEKFIYFTSPQRRDRCSINSIRRAYHNNTLGKLFKKMDEIAFNLTLKEI